MYFLVVQEKGMRGLLSFVETKLLINFFLNLYPPFKPMTYP